VDEEPTNVDSKDNDKKMETLPSPSLSK